MDNDPSQTEVTFRLRYSDRGVEREYKRQFAASTRQYNRIGIYISTGSWIFAIGGIFAAIPDEVRDFSLVAASLIPIYAVAVLASYSNRWTGLSQWTAAVVNVTSALALILIGSGPVLNPLVFTVGTLIVVFFAPFILRLGFVFSASATVLNVLVAEGVLVFVQPFSPADAPIVMVCLLLGGVASVTGAFFLEIGDRRVFSLRRELEDSNAQLRLETYTDALTGLRSRHFFFRVLDDEIVASRRYKHPLSFAMLDMDLFKKVNDELGHPVGDTVLVEFAELIRSTFRKSDMVGRYGGEEFVILFRDTTLENAQKTLARFLDLVRNHTFSGVPWTISFSAGLVELTDESNSLELAKGADDLLLRAKHEGRSQIVSLAESC